MHKKDVSSVSIAILTSSLSPRLQYYMLQNFSIIFHFFLRVIHLSLKFAQTISKLASFSKITDVLLEGLKYEDCRCIIEQYF